MCLACWEHYFCVSSPILDTAFLQCAQLIEEVGCKLALEGRVGLWRVDMARKVILGRSISTSHKTGKCWFSRELGHVQVGLGLRPSSWGWNSPRGDLTMDSADCQDLLYCSLPCYGLLFQRVLLKLCSQQSFIFPWNYSKTSIRSNVYERTIVLTLAWYDSRQK